MSVYERNSYWYAEIPLPNGKKLKRSVGKKGIVTKAMARQVEQELKRKVKLGQWDLMRDAPTFSDYIPEFISYLRDIKQNRAWRVAKTSVESFAKFFGSKKLVEITSADVEDYKRLKTQVGKKPATINRQLAFVRHLFNYAKRCNKFYANNPVSIAGLLPVNNQRTRILTIEEEDLLLNNAEEPIKSMIQIAILTGLRLNSIRTLTWKCVDLNSNTITVESVYSKNKKIHIAHICNTIRKVLLEAKLRSGKSEYVFPDAMALSESGIGDRFTRLCAKLGIRGLRFHDLRHTCGTRLAEIGYDVGAISKVLGHSSIAMSMRYIHPKNSIKKAMEDLANYKTFATNFTTSEKLEEPN